MKGKKQQPVKRPVGRPSKYNPEIADSICQELATSSKGIHKIAENHGVTASTVWLWLTQHQEFSEKYARAKDLQAEFMMCEIIDIADDSSNDTLTTEFGQAPNHEWISRSKLRVDTRKWLMSKLAPKKFGDKLDVTSAGEAITTKSLTIEPISKGKG